MFSQELQILDSICTIFYLIVLLVGFIGNALAISVFSRPRFHNTIFHVYFRFHLMVDVFVIANSLHSFIKFQFDYSIDNTSSFMCIIRHYLLYSLSATSSWLYATVAIYRLLDVLFPAKFTIKKRPTFQLAICLLCVVLNLALYSQILVTFAEHSPIINNTLPNTNLNNNYTTNLTSPIDKYTCDLNYPEWLIWTDLFNSTIGPFVIMTTCILVTMIFLFVKRAAIANAFSALHTSPNANTTKILKRDKRYGLIVLFIDVNFLLLNLPVCIVNFLPSSDTSDVVTFSSHFANMVWYWNYTSLFLVNTLINSTFRSEMYLMLKEKGRRFVTLSSRTYGVHK